MNQLAGQEHLVIGILDRQVGYDAAEVGIAAPLTQTVDRALNLARPVPYRGQRVGHGQLAVVVRVNAERNSDLTRDFLDGLGDLFGKRAAIGVAKHDPGGPGIGGSPQGSQRVIGIVLETVEKVLSVVDDLGHTGRAEGNRIGDHPQVLIEGDAQHLPDMQVPGLAHDRHDRGPGGYQGFHTLVVFRGQVTASGHAEGRDLGVTERKLAHGTKIGGIFGIGKRIAPFDILNAQLIETGGDHELVLQGEVDPLALAAVTQGCVVNGDSRHVLSCRPAWLDFQEGLLARFLSRFYQTATLNHDSETRDHITWFISTGLARVRLGKALQTSASINSRRGTGAFKRQRNRRPPMMK